MTALRMTDLAAVERLRATLACDRELYEVAAGHGGGAWQRSLAAAPFDWHAALPLEGVKRFFFPPAETLLSWRDGAPREERPQVPPFALFGVRACDLTALAYQDRFFARDPYYAERRRQAFVVGVNCVQACAGGFCVEVDAGPFAREGFDLALTRLGDDGVVVAVGSAAGERVLADARVDPRPISMPQEAALARAEAGARASFTSRPALQRGIARLGGEPGSRAIADEEWQQIGPLCFTCTGCTSLCPTCSCFTIEDETRGSEGERRRCWDSCLLEGFQREASGHHPAPRPGDRLRRFWTHKFGREFARELGRIGCVGCGRCDVTCPGAIGAHRVLARLGSEP